MVAYYSFTLSFRSRSIMVLISLPALCLLSVSIYLGCLCVPRLIPRAKNCISRGEMSHTMEYVTDKTEFSLCRSSHVVKRRSGAPARDGGRFSLRPIFSIGTAPLSRNRDCDFRLSRCVAPLSRSFAIEQLHNLTDKRLPFRKDASLSLPRRRRKRVVSESTCGPWRSATRHPSNNSIQS